MKRAFSRDPGRCVSRQNRVSMNRDNQLAVKYRLRQALRAIVMGRQDIMLGLVNEHRGLPEQDQRCQKPACELIISNGHTGIDYRTLQLVVKKFAIISVVPVYEQDHSVELTGVIRWSKW